jgi:(2R)-3-sulfolactate dehydrogenase (NADP+)
MTQLLSLPDVHALACDCLTRAGVPDPVARAVAAEVAAAEAAGERHNGMEALLRDIRLVRYGRIHPDARPAETRPHPGLIRIDAAHGFAAPALLGAAPGMADLAMSQGIAMARLYRASAPGAMIRALEPLSERGLVALAFGGTGPTRLAHPDLAAPVPLGRPLGEILPFMLPEPSKTQPADSPLGGPVNHGAWVIALTQDAVGSDVLEAEMSDRPTPLPPSHEIALSVELLEQIVTA